MTLTPSMEDYLEAIYEIGKTQAVVRVKDVAVKLDVTMPSVNGALKILESKGLITHERYCNIELTDTGVTQATRISANHLTICTFLQKCLGVDAATAEEEACKIEHVVSPRTIKKLKAYINDHEKTTI